jgi:hypothetical protein
VDYPDNNRINTERYHLKEKPLKKQSFLSVTMLLQTLLSLSSSWGNKGYPGSDKEYFYFENNLKKKKKQI